MHQEPPFSSSLLLHPSGETGMRQATETYKEAVRSSFSSLKRIARPDHLRERRLPLPAGGGFLVPVCELHASDRELIATLARWRRRNTPWYPTQFRVTE